ncbi:MAG: PorT family protein [Flavisolibacter sp.]|jgi:hypothetical protein|nr:PorT family protein [Flavisolibacter sp.]
MKNRFFFLCAVALFITISEANSQTRIRAGINLANISVTDGGEVNRANTLTSFQAGIITELPLAGNNITLQPGILYTGKGSKIESGDPNSLNYYKATVNPFYIEVPVTLVFKAGLGTGTNFFAGAGPYGAIGVTGKRKIEGKVAGIAYSGEKNIDFSNDDPTTFSQDEGAGYGIMRRFDYGLNGTAGIEGKSVVLGVNYGLGLAKLQSGTNSSQNNNNKHRVVSFTIGFKL